MIKTCHRCNLEKDISCFHYHKGYKDKHSSWCRTCHALYRSSRKFTPLDGLVSKKCRTCKLTKSISEFSKNRTMTDGYQVDCKSCRKIICKYNAKYFSDYYLSHSESYKTRARQRKAFILGLPEHYTINEWNLIKSKFSNRCVCCLSKGKLTVDHIIPLKRGGTDTIDNIQPVCKSCNSSKGIIAIDYRPFFINRTS